MSVVTDRADRLAAFLNDDAVVAGLTAMKDANYNAFLRADTAEGRAMAQAQAVVLDAFCATMRGVVDAGERERLEAERRPPRSTR